MFGIRDYKLSYRELYWCCYIVAFIEAIGLVSCGYLLKTEGISVPLCVVTAIFLGFLCMCVLGIPYYRGKLRRK